MAETTSKLRIGLLLDSFDQPVWVQEMLERVIREGHAEIVLVVKNDAPPPASMPWYKRLWRRRKTLFYSLYERIEARLFSIKRDAFALKSIATLLEQSRHLNILPVQGKFTDRISPTDVSTIQDEDLDVLFRLGFRILKGEILQAARCGVWSFHHGDPALHRGGPAGVWEVLLGEPTTGTMLQSLSEELDGGLVLAQTFASTDPLSVRRNRNNIYWKTLSLLPRELQHLSKLGVTAYLERKTRQQPLIRFYSEPLYKAPQNWQMIRYGWSQAMRLLKHRLNSYWYRSQWILLARKTTSFDSAWGGFQKLLPPPNRFWADPTLVVEGGKLFLFLEDYDYATSTGSIAVLELDEDGRWQQDSKLVLQRPYHLSYPFLFQWQGCWYMLPETAENQTLEVYRCVEFPHRWELAATLMDNINAVDGTLLEHNNRWWLFVNIRENLGASTWDELFLFSADSPLSNQWQPHPLNPIVSDVRRARPAGAIFTVAGKLIRPSQDCSTHYGRALKFNEILLLDSENYQEREIATVEPNFDAELFATHSFTSAGGWMIGDANRWKSKIIGRNSR